MRSAWMRSKTRFLYRLVLFFMWSFFKLFYRYRVYGKEPVYTGGAIIAANHVSFYDPPLISVSWPEEIHFLARESLFKGFFGKFISRLNSHPISGDVKSIAVMRTIAELLKEGKQVVLFPEGRRSKSGELGEIKPGISMLISRSKAAIIPVYIHGAFDVWPRSKKFPKLRGTLACIFGSPIMWSEFEKLEKKEAMAAVSQRLKQAIEQLKQWYEEGANGAPP